MFPPASNRTRDGRRLTEVVVVVLLDRARRLRGCVRLPGEEYVHHGAEHSSRYVAPLRKGEVIGATKLTREGRFGASGTASMRRMMMVL